MPPAFQSDIPLRSGCLRVSGAVAPSATTRFSRRLSRRVRLPDSIGPVMASPVQIIVILTGEVSRATAAANRPTSEGIIRKPTRIKWGH